MSGYETGKVDEEVVSVAEGADSPWNGFNHAHPCFGMIRVSRSSSSHKHHLFGSEIGTSNIMNIEISEGTVRQDLGRNWYHSKKRIVDIEMTPVQYAEMISSPNTQGSPCTIKYRADKGQIVPRSIDTVTQFVESEVDRHIVKARADTQSLVSDVNAILSQKGGLKVADKEAIRELVGRLQVNVGGNFDFLIDSGLESIEKAKSEAKVEVDSFVSHAISSAGIQAINNAETLKLLIDAGQE